MAGQQTQPEESGTREASARNLDVVVVGAVAASRYERFHLGS